MHDTEMWHCISKNEPIKRSILFYSVKYLKYFNNYAESLDYTSCPWEMLFGAWHISVVLCTNIFNKATFNLMSLLINVPFNF